MSYSFPEPFRSIPPKQGFSAIQFLNFFHILLRNFKIKDSEVLFHALLMDGFRNYRNFILHQIPQCNLCRCFSVFVPKLLQ